MHESRQSPRIRSFLRGEIVHSHGASRTECTIRDISESGARLQVPSSVTIPEYFELVIPQRGISEQVRIAWRHATEIGAIFVKLTGAAPARPSDAEQTTRFAALEAEIALLKAQVSEMHDFVHDLANSQQRRQ